MSPEGSGEIRAHVCCRNFSFAFYRAEKEEDRLLTFMSVRPDKHFLLFIFVDFDTDGYVVSTVRYRVGLLLIFIITFFFSVGRVWSRP